MRLACISGKLKGLTQSRCKCENQNASNSAAFNEIATSQQLLLSRLPLGFAAFDQRPCFLPDTRSWRFMPAPKVRKNPKPEEEPVIMFEMPSVAFKRFWHAFHKAREVAWCTVRPCHVRHLRRNTRVHGGSSSEFFGTRDASDQGPTVAFGAGVS